MSRSLKQKLEHYNDSILGKIPELISRDDQEIFEYVRLSLVTVEQSINRIFEILELVLEILQIDEAVDKVE